MVCNFFSFLSAQESETFYKQSLEQYTLGNYPQALEMINRAISIDSMKADYRIHRASIYYSQEKYDLVIRDCYAAGEYSANDARIYLLRGKVCMATKSYGGAIVLLGKAIKNTTDVKLLSEAYFQRGNAYFEMAQYREAIEDFKSAGQFGEKSVDLLMAQANTYFRLKQFDNALNLIKEILSTKPDFAGAYELTGKIYLEMNEFSAAIEAFEKNTQLRPNDFSAFNLLAGAFLNNQDFDNALINIRKSIAIDPSEPYAHKLSGLIFLKQGDVDKGCNALFKAMMLGYLEKYNYDLLDFYIQNCEK
jgi:tetratricopeptide (TPR) repeat protein